MTVAREVIEGARVVGFAAGIALVWVGGFSLFVALPLQARAQEMSPAQIAVQVTKGVGLLSELADNQLRTIQALQKQVDQLTADNAELKKQIDAPKKSIEEKQP